MQSSAFSGTHWRLGKKAGIIKKGTSSSSGSSLVAVTSDFCQGRVIAMREAMQQEGKG